MKLFNLLLALTISVFFIANIANAQSYKVQDGSKLMWTGNKVSGSHNGEIMIKSGNLVKEGEKMTGDFTVDMTSINCLDLEGDYKGKLEGHLASADFFNVEEHKTATFEITKVRPVRTMEEGNTTHKVTGNLTIKGITNEIEFPASIKFDGDKFMADAAFDIDRTKWDVKYGSGGFFDGLGDKMIYDDIEFELSLVGAKAKMMNKNSSMPTTAPSKK